MHKLAGKDTACVRDMGWDKPILRAEHCWQTRRKRYRLFLMCIYIYIYIYTNIPQIPSSLLFPLCFPPHCAGGAHCLERGLIRAGAHTTGSTWCGPLEISGGKMRVQRGSRSPSHPGVQLQGRTQSGFAISTGVQPEETRNKATRPRVDPFFSRMLPGYLVPSLNLRSIGQPGGADRRRAVTPLTLKDTPYASSPIFRTPRAQRGIRAGWVGEN